MSESKPVTQVNCPHCGQIVSWTPSQRHRPFCSERCKSIDFGDWAGEHHRIAGEPGYPEDNPPEDFFRTDP